LISTVVLFQAQNRETINSTLKVAVSFKIIMTTSVTRPCFTTQHQTCKTKTVFWIQTGLVLRPTVSDHITGNYAARLAALTEVCALASATLVCTRVDRRCGQYCSVFCCALYKSVKCRQFRISLSFRQWRRREGFCRPWFRAPPTGNTHPQCTE